MLGPCFVVWFLAIILLRKRELADLLQLCCTRGVCAYSVSFPHDAVGWSAVCDCGISWSNSPFGLKRVNP